MKLHRNASCATVIAMFSHCFDAIFMFATARFPLPRSPLSWPTPRRRRRYRHRHHQAVCRLQSIYTRNFFAIIPHVATAVHGPPLPPPSIGRKVHWPPRRTSEPTSWLCTVGVFVIIHYKLTIPSALSLLSLFSLHFDSMPSIKMSVLWCL